MGVAAQPLLLLGLQELGQWEVRRRLRAWKQLWQAWLCNLLQQQHLQGQRMARVLLLRVSPPLHLSFK